MSRILRRVITCKSYKYRILRELYLPAVLAVKKVGSSNFNLSCRCHPNIQILPTSMADCTNPAEIRHYFVSKGVVSQQHHRTPKTAGERGTIISFGQTSKYCSSNPAKQQLPNKKRCHDVSFTFKIKRNNLLVIFNFLFPQCSRSRR